jgi:hypothetical protein
MKQLNEVHGKTAAQDVASPQPSQQAQALLQVT